MPLSWKTKNRGNLKLLIPRYVAALNMIGQEAGFKTTVGLGRIWDDQAQETIVSTWRGPAAAFERLTFLPPTVRRAVHANSATLLWPNRQTPIFCGHMTVHAGWVTVRLDGGAPPRSIRTAGGVEVLEHEDCTTYHGTEEALRKAGIYTRFPKKKVTFRTYSYGGPGEDPWQATARYPDGSYLHRRENAESFGRRVREHREREDDRRREKAACEHESVMQAFEALKQSRARVPQHRHSLHRASTEFVGRLSRADYVRFLEAALVEPRRQIDGRLNKAKRASRARLLAEVDELWSTDRTQKGGS